MDREKLIAGLLLRGYEKTEDPNNPTRDTYINADVAVVIRRNRAIVGVVSHTAEDALAFADLMTMTGDQDEQPIAGTD